MAKKINPESPIGLEDLPPIKSSLPSSDLDSQIYKKVNEEMKQRWLSGEREEYYKEVEQAYKSGDKEHGDWLLGQAKKRDVRFGVTEAPPLKIKKPKSAPDVSEIEKPVAASPKQMTAKDDLIKMYKGLPEGPYKKRALQLIGVGKDTEIKEFLSALQNQNAPVEPVAADIIEDIPSEIEQPSPEPIEKSVEQTAVESPVKQKREAKKRQRRAKLKEEKLPEFVDKSEKEPPKEEPIVSQIEEPKKQTVLPEETTKVESKPPTIEEPVVEQSIAGAVDKKPKRKSPQPSSKSELKKIYSSLKKEGVLTPAAKDAPLFLSDTSSESGSRVPSSKAPVPSSVETKPIPEGGERVPSSKAPVPSSVETKPIPKKTGLSTGAKTSIAGGLIDLLYNAPQVMSDIEERKFGEAGKTVAETIGGATGGTLLPLGISALTGGLGAFGGAAAGVAGYTGGRKLAGEAYDAAALGLSKLGIDTDYASTLKEQEEKEKLEKPFIKPEDIPWDPVKGIQFADNKKTYYRQAPFSPYQSEGKLKSLIGRDRLSDKQLNQVISFISEAESGGTKDPYAAKNVNQSGEVTLGKYQLKDTFHKAAIESKYGIPFEDIIKPENRGIQDKYFKEEVLPELLRQADRLAPKAEAKGIDKFTLVGMLQLGVGNIENYLNNKELPESVKKEIDYYTASGKKFQEREQKNALAQMKSSGSFIPFKSPEAKLDTELEQYGELGTIPASAPVSRFALKSKPEDKSEDLAKPDEKEEEQKSYDTSIAKEETDREIASEPSRLEKALKYRDALEYLSMMSSGTEKFASGLAGALSKTAPVETYKSDFGKKLSDLGTYGVQKAQLLEKEAKEAKTEKEEKDLKDPQSEKSKRLQDYLVNYMGMTRDQVKDLSYQDYKDFGVSAIYLKTKQAEAKQQSDISRSLEKKDTQKKQFIRSEVQNIRGNKVTELKGKMNDAYNRIKTTIGKDGAYDLMAVYNFITMLDPSSSVKEGEVKLTRETEALWGELNRKVENLKKTGTKKIIDEEVKAQIEKIASDYNKAVNDRYNNLINQSVTLAEELYDMDPKDARRYFDQYYQEPSQAEQSGSSTSEEPKKIDSSLPKLKNKRQPGEGVNLGGKKYTVGEDGITLIPYEE